MKRTIQNQVQNLQNRLSFKEMMYIQGGSDDEGETLTVPPGK